MTKKIAIVVNSSWNLFNFRMNLVKAISDSGFDILLVAPKDEYSERLGYKFRSIDMDRKGKNPFKELKLKRQLYRIYKEEKVDLVCHFTIKLNIWGSFAARKAGIPSVNNISGLGTAFISPGFSTKIIEILYRKAFKKASFLFFQNPDDVGLFKLKRLIGKTNYGILPGSGIDLDRFKPAKIESYEPFVFLMCGRLIRDKGVYEYLEAIEIVKKQFPDTIFRLLGDIDPGNLTSLTQNELDRAAEIVEHLGWSDKVEEHLAEAHCVVLPSYREGTPRSMLEAMAMGKILLTTDTVGCRETVLDGENGFLVKLKSGSDLADKMIKVLSLSSEEKRKMEKASIQLAKTKFDEKLVHRFYLNLIHKLC